MPARDRKRPFWSRWVWKDWDAKTRDLDPWEYTAYHRLLSYAATASKDLCSIPDDDRRLARAAGVGIKKWRSIRAKVLSYFVLCEAPDGIIPGREMPFLSVHRWYRHERLREDSEAWFQLVEANTSRVNRALQERTTGGQPQGQLRARGSEVRSKIQSDSERELKFGSSSRRDSKPHASEPESTPVASDLSRTLTPTAPPDPEDSAPIPPVAKAELERILGPLSPKPAKPAPKPRPQPEPESYLCARCNRPHVRPHGSSLTLCPSCWADSQTLARDPPPVA